MWWIRIQFRNKAIYKYNLKCSNDKHVNCMMYWMIYVCAIVYKSVRLRNNSFARKVKSIFLQNVGAYYNFFEPIHVFTKRAGSLKERLNLSCAHWKSPFCVPKLCCLWCNTVSLMFYAFFLDHVFHFLSSPHFCSRSSVYVLFRPFIAPYIFFRHGPCHRLNRLFSRSPSTFAILHWILKIVSQ